MGIQNWFKRDRPSVTGNTLHIQKWITKTSFWIFIGLILYSFYIIDKANYEEVKTTIGIFLPLLAGWIGAIIAFYFSKELGDTLNKRIDELKEEKKETSFDVAKLEEKVSKEKSDYSKKLFKLIQSIIEKNEEISSLKKQNSELRKNVRKRPKK